MTTAVPALSLADVARLARVERPVVSMWRNRPKDGLEFPAPLGDGRFRADDIVDWLEQTHRGNNPDARGDLALQSLTGAHANLEHLTQLQTLLAARVLIDEPLSDLDVDDLVDEIDALDPDDDFLFSELTAISPHALTRLAPEVDALADAAWHPRNAFDQLTDTIHRRSPAHDPRLQPDLVSLLAATTTALLGAGGTVVDLEGTCTDVVIHMGGDDDTAMPAITLPSSKLPRETLRRYHVHGVAPHRPAIHDDWALDAGSVVLARLPAETDAALDLLDELTLQLPTGAQALVIGPARVLTDALPATLVARRDVHLRAGHLRAAVRLPQGLTRGGTREHLALWLIAPNPTTSRLWVGDLSGHPFTRVVQQHLLDDLLATCQDPRGRAFSTLEPADPIRIITGGTSLVAARTARPVALAPSAADDSARIQQLRVALAVPLPDALPNEPVSIQPTAPTTMRLGDAIDQGRVVIISGTRITDLPAGATPLWTPDAVAARAPASVNLLKLTQAHPRLQLTQPGDVIFTSHGAPAAVVDQFGGAAVAYPARVLRSRSDDIVPHAVAEAINALTAGNSKWRTWTIPLSAITREDADTLMQHLEDYDMALRHRQTQLHELRRLVTRSVLSGAITLTSTTAHHTKGQ